MNKKSLLLILPAIAFAVGGCTPVEGGGQATPVEPTKPVDNVSVSLNKTTLTLPMGSSETLVATVTGTTAEQSWTSNRPEIASVDQTGKVTAVADEGSAVITVTVAGKSAFCTVTVTPDEGGGGGSEDEVDALSLAEAIALMDAAGDSVVVAGLKKVKGVVASGSNFKSDYGEYSGHFEGQDNFLFTFKDPNNLLNGGSADGKEVVIEGYLELYQGNYKLSYLPASVSPTGEKFTPSLVSVEGGGGEQETVPVTAITATPVSVSLQKGATQQISVVISPNNASDKAVSYSSDNEAVATVSASGLITAVAVGTAHVTVTSHGNSALSSAISVTVTEQEVPVTVHAGTFEDPFDGADALAVANTLTAGAKTNDFYYIKGTVAAMKEDFSPDFGNFSFAIDSEDGFVCWRLKNGEGKESFENASDLAIGDEVVVKAKIQLYKNKDNSVQPETCDGFIVSIKKPGAATPTEILDVVEKPATVSQNETISASTVKLSVKFSDGSTQEVNAQSVTCDTSSVGNAVATAHFESLTKTFNIEVVAKSTPQHAGTISDPYTVSDAKLVFDGLKSGENTEMVYVEGDVIGTPAPKQEGSGDGKGVTFYTSDGVNTVQNYFVKGIGGGPLDVSEIEEGNHVVVQGVIKNFNGTFEICWIRDSVSCELISNEKPASRVVTEVLDIAEMPTSIEQGTVLDPNLVLLNVKFGEEAGTVKAQRVECNTSTPGDSVPVTAYYGEFPAVSGTIKVTAKEIHPIEVDKELVITHETLELGSYADGVKAGFKWTMLMKGDKNSIQGNISKNSELHNDQPFSKPIKKVVFSVGEKAAGPDSEGKVSFGTTSNLGNDINVGKGTDYSLSTASSSFEITAPEGSLYFAYTFTVGASYFSSIKFVFEDETPVTPKVTSVTVDPATKSIAVDEKVTLAATVLGEGDFDDTVTWSSSDSTKVSVDQATGEITGVAATEEPVIITATSTADTLISGSCAVTVTEKQAANVITVGDTVEFTSDSLGLTGEYASLAEGDYQYKNLSENTQGSPTAIQGTGSTSQTRPDKSVLFNSRAFSKALVGVRLEIGTKVSGATATANLTFGTEVNPTGNKVTLSGSSGTATYKSLDTASSFIEFKLDVADCTYFSLNYTSGAVYFSKIELIFDTTWEPAVAAVNSVSLDKAQLELKKGAEATLVATVDAVNGADASVTWTSSNPDLVSVDGGKIVALGVTGETPVTITATSAFNSEKFATCSVTVTDLKLSNYSITDSVEDLVIGSNVVIVGRGAAKALSTTQNNNNRGATDIVKNEDGSKLGELSESVQVFTLEEGTADGTFAFKCAEGYLLAVKGQNYLRTSKEKVGACNFEITYTEGKALITAAGIEETRVLKFNSTSGLFACYTQGQVDVDIYLAPHADPTEGLKSIEVTQGPTKTEYEENEKFDSTGLVVTASYYGDQKAAEVTGYTLSEPDMSTTGEKEVTVTYTENGVTQTATFKITVVAATPVVHTNTIKAAYEVGAAQTSGTSSEMTMRGEVTSKYLNGSNRVCFLQDGDYAVYAFQFSETDFAKFAVGDEITIKAKMTQYNGTIEATNISSVVKESTDEIATPVAKNLTSKTELDATGQGVLVKANVIVKDALTGWSSSSSKNPKVLLNGQEITLNLNRSVYNETVANKLASLKTGDEMEITNCYVGIYSGVLQMCATERFDVNKVEHAITSITMGGDMTNKTYGPDSSWDYSGITCTASLDNGSTKSLSFDDLTITSLSAAAPAKDVTTLTINVKVTAYPEVTGSITITGISFNESVKQLSSKTTSVSGSNMEVADKVATYSNNDISFRMEQSTSKTAIRTSDTDHLRVYQDYNLTIAFTSNIVKLEITCTSESYAAALAATTCTGGIASANGTVVTITVPEEAPTDTITFSGLSGQTRISGVTVYYY